MKVGLLLSTAITLYNGGWLAERKEKKPTSHETSSLILYILSSGGDITPHRGAAWPGGDGGSRLLEAAAVRESSLHAVTNERRALVRTYL